MSYQCYLFGELMPETPGKLTVRIKGKNKTLELLNEGEINFLRTPGLTEITLPLTFPMLTAVRTPDYYLRLLEKAKTARATTQFVMTRTTPDGRLLFDTNIRVSVEDYTVTENAANGLDVSVEVNLKQYRDFGLQTIHIGSGGGALTKERSSATAPKASSYTVKTGDSLWSIAKYFFGDGAKYDLIYEANRESISDPNLLYAGQILVIPQQ